MECKGYVFKEHKTNEWHIFKVKKMTEKELTLDSNSICSNMENDTKNSGHQFPSDTENYEDKARRFAYKKGRIICGTCISHLYGTF